MRPGLASRDRAEAVVPEVAAAVAMAEEVAAAVVAAMAAAAAAVVATTGAVAGGIEPGLRSDIDPGGRADDRPFQTDPHGGLAKSRLGGISSLEPTEGMSRSVVVAGVCDPGGRPHRGQPQTVHDARHSQTHFFRTLLGSPCGRTAFLAWLNIG